MSKNNDKVAQCRMVYESEQTFSFCKTDMDLADIQSWMDLFCADAKLGLGVDEKVNYIVSFDSVKTAITVDTSTESGKHSAGLLNELSNRIVSANKWKADMAEGRAGAT